MLIPEKWLKHWPSSPCIRGLSTRHFRASFLWQHSSPCIRGLSYCVGKFSLMGHLIPVYTGVILTEWVWNKETSTHPRVYGGYPALSALFPNIHASSPCIRGLSHAQLRCTHSDHTSSPCIRGLSSSFQLLQMLAYPHPRVYGGYPICNSAGD